MRLLAAALVFLAVGAVVPVAQADLLESLLPPEALQGAYNPAGNTIRLEWRPPSNDTATAFLYTIYRNAEAIGTTAQTWYDASLPDALNVFTVTASSTDGQSAPSQPLLVQQSTDLNVWNALKLDLPPFLGLWCEPTGINILNQFPFVSVTIYEECIPIIGNSLNGRGPLDVLVQGA